MKKKYNSLSIIGFIMSFIFSLVGIIVCIVALNNIDSKKEKGRGLAIAGMIISIIKMVCILLLGIATILFAINSNSFDNENDSMCKKATNCVYDSETGYNTCTYTDSDKVEHYITCETEEDTFDYSSYGTDSYDDTDIDTD